jgi:hypothetical protein
MTENENVAGSASPAEFRWALKSSVRVTMIRSDPDMLTGAYLVQNLSAPGALLLEFDDCRVLLNGKFVDLGDDLPCWCGLADVAAKPGDSVDVLAEDVI